MVGAGVGLIRGAVPARSAGRVRQGKARVFSGCKSRPCAGSDRVRNRVFGPASATVPVKRRTGGVQAVTQVNLLSLENSRGSRPRPFDGKALAEPASGCKCHASRGVSRRGPRGRHARKWRHDATWEVSSSPPGSGPAVVVGKGNRSRGDGRREVGGGHSTEEAG